MAQIIISVIVPVYQHKNYIQVALDSILMQKTQYSYEILIGDDYSTDGTRELLKNYKRKYKDKIRLFLRPYNLGATLNGYMLYKQAKGKYISILEGDDYWIDEYKLEKQVKYLESHKEYSAVFHKCKIVNEKGEKARVNYSNFYHSKEGYAIEDYEKGMLPGQVGTIMFKNIFSIPNKNYNFYYKIHNLVGDQTLYCLLLAEGSFGYISEELGAYRFVQKIGKTNAMSRYLKRNVCFEEWKYHCKLEMCMKKKVGKNINLKEYRKQEVKVAKRILKEKKDFISLFMFLKICVLNILWDYILKFL